MIRRATMDDSLAIATMHVASWRETYINIIPTAYIDTQDVPHRHKVWSDILARDHNTFVYEIDGKIVGFVSGGKIRDDVEDYKGELYAIYLLKAYHRHGIGKNLFTTMSDLLKTEGLHPFTAWVLVDNPTLGFYHHMGAQTIGERVEDFDGIKLSELQLGWR